MIRSVIKRNSTVVDFDLERIRVAVLKSYRAADVDPDANGFDTVIDNILREIGETFPAAPPRVEGIQDIVERCLMTQQHYEVAKKYILYREKHRELRESATLDRIRQASAGRLQVVGRDGRRSAFDLERARSIFRRASAGHEADVSIDLLVDELLKNIFDGITNAELERAHILASASFIERDPAYDIVTSRLMRRQIYREVFGEIPTADNLPTRYRHGFRQGIEVGIAERIFDSHLSGFNLETLSDALHNERDDLLTFLSVQTLRERYFVHHDGSCIETPQAFWMRVAMGLAQREDRREERAIEYYDVLSTLRFVSSTPTLFHAGMVHPQLSSCYISTVKDDLAHIFKVIADNAQLSKWSGGIGNDWSSIRATGALIKSTNVESQGIIPFLKIANDTTVAINRSGKRRGATCAYLETWHLDIEDFLDLRRNTGDDRRRTHDMNTANWIPDLFMKRVRDRQHWTLFSPDEAPDLHEIYGKAFEERYMQYEREAQAGRIHKYRTIDAVKLWRKMITRLFETGHPWLCFKDPCNVRSPQDHAGVVHSSNLCTEITLNNSEEETAVCNLGSINLARHTGIEGLNTTLLEQTVHTAMRMLDTVIDINFYPTKEAKRANLTHRPVGLGLMGFQDALFIQRIPFDSPEAVVFADTTMETISYFAILSSSRLAKELGRYGSYTGSKWDRGIFPVDTLDLLERERGMPIPLPRAGRLDWQRVREHVQEHGMRNSNVMAIAPTATISNIADCFPCIEPIYKNIYVKANMSGEFTIVNKYLIRDLKRYGLWNESMLEQLKYYDGNVGMIAGIPDHLKSLYKEVFDIDPMILLEHSARRGKWIDQSQSHNVFIDKPSGNWLSDIYQRAWELGLKTTYYLRSLGASQIEKSTLDARKYGYTQKRIYNEETGGQSDIQPATVAAACLIDDPDCEVCQ